MVCSQAATSGNGCRPNLLFVFPDQFRQQALGCMGQDPVITPNLNALAAQGLVFRRAASNFPVCSPYRAMLFTGCYPFANGVVTNCNSRTAPSGIYLRATDRCLSDILQEEGYATGYVGKWHLDPPEEPYEYLEPRRRDGVIWDAYTPPGPRRHGFTFWHSYGCCDNHLHPHYWHGDAPVEARIDVDGWSVQHEADVVIDFLRNQGGQRDPHKPFALFWAPNPPHTPFDQVPAEYASLYASLSLRELLNRANVDLEGRPGRTDVAIRGVRNYFAAVTGVDDQLGRVLRCLHDEGLDENTIVVFTADHGEMMGSHGAMHKPSWYDEAFLVPFIIRWPGHIEPGVSDVALNVPDLLPSLLGLLGIGHRCPAGLEGEDVSWALAGQRRGSEGVSLYIDPTHRGLRTERYTYALPCDPASGEPTRLYDNVNDPYQLQNIAAHQPAVVRALHDRMLEMLRRIADPWARTCH